MRAHSFFCIALLPSLLALAATAHAQAPVAGTVQDGAGHGLPFATAVLLHLPDSTVAASQTTTAQGAFRFERVAAGRYCLQALALGYAAGRVPVLVGSAPVQVPALHLQATATALKEVVVQGRPPLLEQHADRTVVNIDRLNTAGDNALEALKKIPGITLDQEEHLHYRGSGSVLVLLDGKPSYLTGEALSQYLKSIPAAQLSQVELLPNPPASLDAAGTAGVINIRTKRSILPGLTGTLTGTAAKTRYTRGSTSANLAYNVGRVRTFGRVGIGYSDFYNQLTVKRLIRDTTFTQQNYWRPLTGYLSYAAGADVALTKHHTLGGQVRGSYSAQDAQVSSESVVTAADGRLAGYLAMRNPRANTSRDLALNLNYRWALDTLGRELTADADLVQGATAGHQDFLPLNSPPTGAVGALVGQQRSRQGSDVTIRALKVDYVHPLPGHWRAEAGAKASWVTTNSRLAFEKLGATSNEWQLDSNRTNTFQYDERIAAGYFTLSTTLKKLELKAGLRGEHTHSVGESPTTGQRVARDYFQLFPTLFASYQFSPHDQLSLSAGRRISRPSYQNLNPFINYTDAYTAMQGNPYLAPSLARSFVLNYLHRGFQVLSLSYLLETNVVNEVAYQNDQTKVTTTRPMNLDQALTLTLSSGGHTDLTKWWGMDNQVGATYGEVQTLVDGQAVQLRQLGAMATSNHTFNLPRHYQLLVGGEYNGPSVNGLFALRASGAFNLGLRKQLWQEKATLSLKLSDLFYTDGWFSSLHYQNINTDWVNRYDSRRLTVSFTYKLGGGKTHSARTSSSADEEGRAGH
ncbi:TonB-dependent receptor [Hymenobacter sp. BRD128]|uniref:outer membrane beta-barrel protein n=1 Tax=Hymenobacter sp. BRD128 TaxID=2675878 RepID=UPI0015671BE1|nr:outer membrane beta-barrel protein [Hymenobacter sp. BRD128]QKG55857.1 TonB-dependent receptor [Hymenobacter sp. BRD128]